MKPKNKKAFKALIKKYESIKLEDIPEFALNTQRHVKRDLTGFGYMGTCTLCLTVNNDCNKCVWYTQANVEFACDYGSKDTYEAIEDAETPEQLLQAYRARAEHMKQVLKSLNKPGKGKGLHLGVVIIDEAKNLNENNNA